MSNNYRRIEFAIANLIVLGDSFQMDAVEITPAQLAPHIWAKVLAFTLSLILSFGVSGTAQTPDRIVLGGKAYSLNTNPLDSYFSKYPDRHPRNDQDSDEVVLNSGLWRGYIATFVIVRDELRLRKFYVPKYSSDGNDRLVSKLKRFFPTRESRRLSWYTGIMVIPTGARTKYVHLNYGSEYDSYILLRIEGGRVVDRANFSGEMFLRYKRKQFELYQQTDDYIESLDRIRGDSDDSVDADRFIFRYGSFVEHVILEFDAIDSDISLD